MIGAGAGASTMTGGLVVFKTSLIVYSVAASYDKKRMTSLIASSVQERSVLDTKTPFTEDASSPSCFITTGFSSFS